MGSSMGESTRRGRILKLRRGAGKQGKGQTRTTPCDQQCIHVLQRRVLPAQAVPESVHHIPLGNVKAVTGQTKRVGAGEQVLGTDGAPVAVFRMGLGKWNGRGVQDADAQRGTGGGRGDGK